METHKMGFFLRVNKAIFKFEEYEKFIVETIKRAFLYFFKLVLIFSFIITISLIYALNNYINDFLQVFKTEFPQIVISNNELNIEGSDKFNYYFEDLDLQIVMDENQLVDINTDYDNSIILLKNKVIVKLGGVSQKIYYEDVQIDKITNREIIEIFENENRLILCAIYGIILLLTNFITYAIIFLLDIITLAIIGQIINIIIRTSFKFVDLFKISIYAMTLPIILYLIYVIANFIFGITIEYFNLGYKAISYIYLITVLLIMKSDIIKNMQELQTIMEEQKNVREKIKQEKQEEKYKERKKRR